MSGMIPSGDDRGRRVRVTTGWAEDARGVILGWASPINNVGILPSRDPSGFPYFTVQLDGVRFLASVDRGEVEFIEETGRRHPASGSTGRRPR